MAQPSAPEVLGLPSKRPRCDVATIIRSAESSWNESPDSTDDHPRPGSGFVSSGVGAPLTNMVINSSTYGAAERTER
jgi:hypothetical protein